MAAAEFGWTNRSMHAELVAVEPHFANPIEPSRSRRGQMAAKRSQQREWLRSVSSKNLHSLRDE